MEQSKRQDDIRMDIFEKEITEVKGDLRNIRDNHLFHIAEDLAILKTKMATIQWLGGAIGTTSVGSLISSLLNLITK